LKEQLDVQSQSTRNIPHFKYSTETKQTLLTTKLHSILHDTKLNMYVNPKYLRYEVLVFFLKKKANDKINTSWHPLKI